MPLRTYRSAVDRTYCILVGRPPTRTSGRDPWESQTAVWHSPRGSPPVLRCPVRLRIRLSPHALRRQGPSGRRSSPVCWVPWPLRCPSRPRCRTSTSAGSTGPSEQPAARPLFRSTPVSTAADCLDLAGQTWRERVARALFLYTLAARRGSVAAGFEPGRRESRGMRGLPAGGVSEFAPGIPDEFAVDEKLDLALGNPPRAFPAGR